MLSAVIILVLVHLSAGDDREILRRTLPAYALAQTGWGSKSSASLCKYELETFRQAVDNRTLWALKMLDSSGEPKPGFVYGNNYWLGSRSQCIDGNNHSPFILEDETMRNNSRYRDVTQEFPPYRLNYFVAYFRHNSTLQYHVRLPNEDLVSLGVCLPASCTNKELEDLLSSMFRDRSLIVGELYSADFQLIQVKDLQDDGLWLHKRRIALINTVLGLILALMIVGTAYDVLVFQRAFEIRENPKIQDNNNVIIKLTDNLEKTIIIRESKPGVLGKILMCFSVYSNTKLIFDTKLNQDSVAPIHGLRFLGMVWIIMIHTVFYMSDYADNKAWSWRLAEGLTMQLISNSTFSVDTFFFLSGFLVAYMYLNAHKNDKLKYRSNYGLKILEFIVTVIRRFIRLTPAYMMMVGIIQVNASYYDKNSQFYMTERPQETCEKYWWRNILYINNLFGRETMCMSWSWYLSNDMQFFIIAEFILILSSIFYKAAMSVLLFLLAGSIFTTGFIAYLNNYVPTMDKQFQMLDTLYDPPWTRIGPYIIGMITAIFLMRLNKTLPLKKRTVALLWFLSSSCILLVLFGLYDKQLSVFISSIYVSFSRTIWAVGMAWIIIACCTEHGGILNNILCFKAWIPLSRLTYCAYLLNPFLINSIYLQSESAVHVDFLPNFTMFLGNLVVTYVCSFILSLMLETPTVLLMRTFINIKKR